MPILVLLMRMYILVSYRLDIDLSNLILRKSWKNDVGYANIEA